MTEKPILFKAPMVGAILANRKTQTRRVITQLRGRPNITEFGPSDTKGYDWHFRRKDLVWEDYTHEQILAMLPYQVGDLLWVRETFAEVGNVDPQWILYRASGYDQECIRHGFSRPFPPEHSIRWRSPIHMPKRAARIWLRVTGVTVERLQDISEEDAIAEGLASVSKDGKLFKWGIPDRDGLPGNDDFGWHWSDWEVDARKAYRRLWDQINAKRGHGWNTNDWVVAITFERIER